jgi:uncharacterized protein (DUF1778 family)
LTAAKKKEVVKKEVVMVRCTAKEKKLLAKAALLAKRSVSGYVLVTALKQAEADVAQPEK